MKIRNGVPGDIPAFLGFKDRFAMPGETSVAPQGFLMGSTESDYLHFVAQDIVLVLEDEDLQVVGYAIVLCDATVRKGGFWQKRTEVDWRQYSIGDLERGRTCFFEQLAVAPDLRYRAYGKNLGIMALFHAFERHDHAITTVVSAPVRNLASRGFVLAAGFRQVGEVVEDYPHIAKVSSDVFVMSEADFRLQMQGPYARLAEKTMGAKLPKPL